MPNQEFTNIPLHHLPAQPTCTTYRSDQSEASVEDAHAVRMNEFLNRPATPTPFPEELPPRQKKNGINRWMLFSIALLIAFLGTVIPLGILLGIAETRANMQNTTERPPAAVGAPPATTKTTTLATTSISTLIHNITTTTIPPTTITTIQTFFFPQISYITTTISAPSFPTGITTDSETCEKSNEPLMLARNFCVMVKVCNEAALDIAENDCEGFLRDQRWSWRSMFSKGGQAAAFRLL